MTLNLQQKISILDLDQSRVNVLQKIQISKMWQDTDEFVEQRDIQLDDLVGINKRPDKVNNWLEMLDALHKDRNFNIYNAHTFTDVIANPNKYGVAVPTVSYIDGKYYIYGEGKHRLTIAKCLGIEKIKVNVFK